MFNLRTLTLWLSHVDNVVVVSEHVDFLNVLEWLHTELLDGSVNLLVLIHFVGGSDNLLLSSLGSYKAKYWLERLILSGQI